jgi:hypothetical protein
MKKPDKYKWVKENDVIVCEVDGRDDFERFRNYAKMVVEMREAGWKPYKWSDKEKIDF